MIVKITGKLTALYNERAILEIPPFEYEVLIPEFTRRQLQSELQKEITLHTIEYLDGNLNQGRVTPRLLGFLSEAEREFFEIFCSVDGVGVRKALRAMARPARDVASAIEEQDVKALSQLPGIGPATAERVVAKLRRKMSKFALMAARPGDDALTRDERKRASDVVAETYEALLALGHGEAEARKMIDAVVEGGAKFKDSSELIQAIYMNNR